MRRTLFASTAIATAGLLALPGAAVARTASPGVADPGGHARAVREAKKILGDAPVLAGAKRVNKAPNHLLKGPPSYPGENGLVTRSRYWTTTLSATQAYHELTAKTPAGYTSSGEGSEGRYGVIQLRFVDDTPNRLPAKIAYGDLQIAVSALKDGKTGIGVYAETVPQPPRPADEDVPTSVTSVAMSWTVSSQDTHPLTRTITGGEAKRFIAAFNAMQVDTEGVHSCPLSFGGIQAATFVGDGHTWTAAGDNCGGIDVTRDGKALPELDVASAYYRQLQRALGLDVTKRPAAEHVPQLVKSVRIVTTTAKGSRSRTARRSASELISTFDALPTVRSGTFTCTATGTTVTATYKAPHHTWVATQDPCDLIAVTRDGKALPTLADNGLYSQIL